MMGDGRCKKQARHCRAKENCRKARPYYISRAHFQHQTVSIFKTTFFVCWMLLYLPFDIALLFFLLCCNRYAIVTHFYNCQFGLIVLPVHHCRQFHLQLHAESLQGVILHVFRPATQYKRTLTFTHI